MSVSWGSDIAEVRKDTTSSLSCTIVQQSLCLTTGQMQTATPRSGVIEVRRSGNLLPDPFIDPRFMPDHHGGEGRFGNDHDSKANVLDVSSFGLRRTKGTKGGLEVKSASSNGDDGLRSEMCAKQIFPPDDNVANISIYPDTSDLISITKPAASHLKTSLQQARLELENLLNRSKDVEERVRMLSSPTKRGRDGFERTISPYRIRSLSEAQEKEELVSERLAQQLLRERAQEKEAVEVAYSLIKIADESWNYQFETMSAEFKQQQDRARQVETDLEGSKLQLKSTEAQLLQYKAILLKRQEEMNDLTQRNEVLEKQLKVAKEEIARMVDFGNRALRAERKLEIEIKRYQELEEILMAERATHAEEMRRHAEERSGANEDAMHLQERTQKLLSQVSWQGDACRMQMVAEQLKTKHAEDLSNELAQEVLACKKQCQEIQHELAALRGAHSRLLSHRVLLREHKLASVGKNDKAAILVSCFMKWKGESLQSRRCVQCARILTAMRMQRLKISRRRQTSCTPQDVFTWTLPWSQTSKLGILNGPSPLIFNGKRLSDPARGIGRRNGSKLSSSLGHRLVVSAFEILVDQVREARLARKRGKEVETLHVKAVACWLFATTTHMGPEEAATTFRLFSMSGMKSGKGIATSHPGSKSKALMPARSADFRVLRDATFWIWRRSANDLKAKERIVARARSRKDRLLLTSGFMMLKNFVTAIDSAGAYAKSKDDLASLQYFKHWIMTLFHIDMVNRKWKRLSVFVKGLTFKKRKSYAQTWKSCRSMAQEAAVMRCSRVHFANFRGSVLLRLAFMDWIQAALSKHLKFLKCLVSSAVMCRRNQIVDGIRDLVGLQGNVSTDNPAHFLCKRMVFVQWLAITAKLRRTRKKSRIVEHRTWKKILGCFLQCWCNVMRLRLLSRCRLLTKTMQHLLDWRHSVRFIPMFHSAKMTRRLKAAWTYWAECGKSERLRKALLLSFAAMAMRISSCSTSHRREKCLERTSLTSRQIYTRASCKAAKRVSVLCVTLKLLQAEFFALWACKIFADCRDTVRVETVFQKMSSWLTCIQERRCYVVRVYQHRRNRIPKLQALFAWQHTSWTLKRFSVVYKQISSRVTLRSRMTHFRGWKKYITSILSEVCLRKGLIQLEMKRRVFALLRVSCTRGVDFIWPGDSHGRGDSSTCVGRLPSWTTDATDSDWNMSAMSTPTPRSTRSGRSSPVRSGMSSPARLSFSERQLQIMTGDGELQDIEEDMIMRESASWKTLIGEGLIVDRFTRRVFEGVRAYFTEWKKRTIMQLARTKKISRLAKSMHAKSKKVRRIRLSKMWFKVHFEHVSTLKEKVERIQKQAINNRKKEFMFVWRQFQVWLHQKRESVEAAYGESAKNMRALFLHLWNTYILNISDQRKRALQIITRRASCRFARTHFQKWTTKALMQIKARCVVQRLKISPLILKLCRWREAVTEKKILKRKARKLVNLICMRECVLYFQRWCEHRANIIRNKSSAKRVITRILHFALHSAFACWRTETAEKKVTELRSNKIVEQIFKAALVNSFTIWLDLTRENTRLLMAACRVVEISVEKKLRRGVRAFQSIVVYAKCKAHDLYLRTSGLSSRVIWAWTRHAGWQIKKSESQHFDLTSLMKCMSYHESFDMNYSMLILFCERAQDGEAKRKMPLSWICIRQ